MMPRKKKKRYTREELNQMFLAQLPQDQLLLLEAYYRDVIPRGKLLRQVSSGIYMSDADLWQRWVDQNETVEIRFLPLNPATRYEDGDFVIPSEEVAAYYESHQEEFAVPARAALTVVVMGKAPTPADTIASAEHAAAVRQEIIDGADFAEVAIRESSDEQTAPLGGELGIFPKNRMVASFDSAAFAARVGPGAGRSLVDRETDLSRIGRSPWWDRPAVWNWTGLTIPSGELVYILFYPVNSFLHCSKDSIQPMSNHFSW